MTTQTQHTPGPWVSDAHLVLTSDDYSIATVRSKSLTAEETNANAMLMAAAPEMLEALELTISKDMLSGETRDIATAAIAKARGKQA